MRLFAVLGEASHALRVETVNFKYRVENPPPFPVKAINEYFRKLAGTDRYVFFDCMAELRGDSGDFKELAELLQDVPERKAFYMDIGCSKHLSIPTNQ
eukprot:scaffold8126_cov170-Amphora_coffeaeformis.AAC.12